MKPHVARFVTSDGMEKVIEVPPGFQFEHPRRRFARRPRPTVQFLGGEYDLRDQSHFPELGYREYEYRHKHEATDRIELYYYEVG